MSYRDQPASGAGLATYAADGTLLDAFYPAPRLGDAPGSGGGPREEPHSRGGPRDEPHSRGGPREEPQSQGGPREEPHGHGEPHGGLLRAEPRHDPLRQVTVRPLITRIASLADPPQDAADVWLRLHLLSHLLIRPREANLDGIFGLLGNVAWTSLGPVPAADLDRLRMACRLDGRPLIVHSVDKFPRLTDYVTPRGVRIADAARVRLGAHLAPGTTVMHEGFVNYNAGTLGASMVEGRISAGVIVGDGSDIGGGASIMGTLSGGGSEQVTIGQRCLLGANSGVGISLGDDCVVEAGCYVTAGSKVSLPDGRVVRARELSGQPGLLFWRNSVTGALEARPRSGTWGALNPTLHAQ